MYKRTSQAIALSPPIDIGSDVLMFKTQFGKAMYSDISYAISTRIDASGAYGLIEYENG